VHTLALRLSREVICPQIVRRMCSRRVGKRTQQFDFEFSNLNDEHFENAMLPAHTTAVNLNGCREIGEKTLVQLSL
jgi:hypothetical protein